MELKIFYLKVDWGLKMAKSFSETEEYLERALEEYADIRESDKKILKKILFYYLTRNTDYEFREYDSIFEKAAESNGRKE